jgi:predicted small metal-binding protein
MKILNCECGQRITADSDEALIASVGQHVQTSHPELVGKLSDADILNMAEELE